MQTKKTITIIGAGFSGLMSAIALAKQDKFNINLISESNLAKGVAYSTPFDCHLLNVPAAKMSAYHDKPNDFVDWLKSNNHLSSEYYFAPRRLYGEYLNHQLTKYQDKITISKKKAVKISKKSDCYSILLIDNNIIQTDHIVLAPGNLPPIDIFKSFKTIDNGIILDNQINNPWDYNKLANIPKDKSVFILGSGLTMIDVAVFLANNQHQGDIFALSRHGLMPRVHSDKLLTPVKFDNLAGMSLVKIINYLQVYAKNNNYKDDWRAIVDGLRPHSQQIWQEFDINNKKRFLRHMRARWDVIRHRIAPQIGEIISQLIRSSQLKIKAGSLKSIDLNNSKFNISYQPRYTPERNMLSIVEADHIINCTGPNGGYLNHFKDLLGDLISQDLIKADLLNLGFDCDSNGKIADSIFTIGPPTKGVLWENIAVPDIRQQIARLISII